MIELRKQIEVWGTVVDVDCFSHSVSVAQLDVAMENVIEFCEKVDRDFSTYKDGSWVSRLRRGEVSIEDCPADVQQVWDLSLQAKWISDGAIATSGTYERGAHIHDPLNGLIAIGAKSATVVGPLGWLCDSLTTAVMVAGQDSAKWFDQEALTGYQVFEVNRQEEMAWEI